MSKTLERVRAMLVAMSYLKTESGLLAEHTASDLNAVERLIRVDDVDMHVVENGNPDAPTLLLLSNAAAPTAIWDPVVPLLAAAHRIIRVDLLGVGTSARSRGAYHVPTWAGRLAVALEMIDVTRVTVIPHATVCMVS